MENDARRSIEHRPAPRKLAAMQRKGDLSAWVFYTLFSPLRNMCQR